MCNRAAVLQQVKDIRPNVIVHTAAQRSHYLAADVPLDDFDVNAGCYTEPAGSRTPEFSGIAFLTCPSIGDMATGPIQFHRSSWKTRCDYADKVYPTGTPELPCSAKLLKRGKTDYLTLKRP